MRIDQRNAGASVTPTSGQYLVDRWNGQAAQASKYSAQQNAGAITPPAGFSNYLGATSLSAFAAGSTDFFGLEHRIEGNNISDFAWGTASAKAIAISFWVRSSLTGTFGGALYNDTGNRCYPFSYSISVANTWEQKSIYIAGDTSGTWQTGSSIGVQVIFSLGAGSSISGTAGSWGSTLYRSATGATSVVGTNGATFYITGVQLEPGTVATPFERRSYGQELALSQRYYETGDFSLTAGTPGAGTIGSWVPFVVTKRASATLTTALTVGSSGNTTVNSVGFRREAAPDGNGRIAGTFTASSEL